MHKGDLPLIQGLVVDEFRERLHGCFVVQLGNSADEQPEGCVPELPLIIRPAAQLAGQHTLQFLVIACRKGNVVRQLVNGQGVPVLVHVAVDLGTVILEVIGRVQLLALQAVNHWVGEIGHYLPLFPCSFVQKADQVPQLFTNLLKQQNIVGVPEGIRVDFSEQR